MPKAFTLLACSIVTGGIIGWFSIDARAPASAAAPRPAAKASANPETPAWSKEEFITWVANQPDYPPGAMGKVLSTWTDEEIRLALEDSFTRGGNMDDLPGLPGLLRLLWIEYKNRDFDAAVSWLSEIPSRPHRRSVLELAISSWPKDRLEEGMRLIAANKDLISDGEVWDFERACLMKAAVDGPDALVAMIRSINAENLPLIDRVSFTCPPGFDFAELLASGKLTAAEIDQFGLIRSWKREKPDEAFQWVLDHRGAGSLESFAVNSSQPEELQWIGGKLKDLSAEQRSEFYDSMLPSWGDVIPRIAMFVSGANDPALQDEIHSNILRTLRMDPKMEALSLVGRSDDPQKRLRLMENIPPSATPAEQQAARSMTPGQISKLRGELKEWGADGLRIEAIIQRLQR